MIARYLCPTPMLAYSGSTWYYLHTDKMSKFGQRFCSATATCFPDKQAHWHAADASQQEQTKAAKSRLSSASTHQALELLAALLSCADPILASWRASALAV